MEGNILLENRDVIRWCFQGVTEKTLANTSNERALKQFQTQEREWARSVIGGVGSQWTTKLCQDLVMEAMIKLGQKNVRKTKQIKSSIRDKKYSPDLECDEYVYEVKGRNWTTPGTAGEKILGVPLKYGEVPTLYRRPLRIVLVGYQEYEARKAFAFGDLLNSQDQTKELKNSLAFYKEHNIEYVGFTDVLKKLGFGKEYWNE